jgi:predicted nucleic acid-binding protein
MKKKQTNVLDASAIIKLVIKEEGSDNLLEYCGRYPVFDTTSLCFSEAVGYLKSLRYFQNEISDDMYLAASDQLLAMLKDEVIRINNANLYDTKDWLGVEELIEKYSIDISEAFQVYSIKHSFFSEAEKYPAPVLITGDTNLAATLRAENIPVWNCLEQE